MSKILIKSAKVVNPDKVQIADILIEDGFITSVGANGVRPPQQDNLTIIDGTGLLAFPGFIDFHVHLQDQMGEFKVADTYEHGTEIALKNGITTVCSFITQKKGMSLKETVEETVSTYLPVVHTDMHWHLTPTTFSESDFIEIEELIDKGYHTFKFYTTYRDKGLFAEYSNIEAFANRFKDKDITIMVHCQDDDILRQGKFNTVSEIDSSYSQSSELEAVRRIKEIAEKTKVHLHIVHTSNSASIAPSDYLTYETAPQYLFNDESIYKCITGYKYLCSPYFGTQENRLSLIDNVKSGNIALIATDHCPFSNSDKSKCLPELSKIPNGLCGLDYLVPLTFKAINPQTDQDYSHICRLLSTASAKLIGQSHLKGRIEKSYQADVVLIDPTSSCPLSARDDLFNPYDGIVSDIQVVTVIRKGVLIDSLL
ncbi:MAG: amidohydrolase family protein [Candidatus Zophobacter franzmannii]|nr:amidohydrolase family protein [Candidatus Zophobacter franzmannii]